MRNIYTFVLATLLSLLAPSTTIAQIDWHTTPIPEYINQVNATATVRKAPAGNIIIAGKGDSLRAFSPWSGGGGRDTLYAQVANLYKKEFPNVNIYVMPIPTQGAFYCPDGAKEWTRSEGKTIETIFKHLDKEVNPVNIYTTLGAHAAEGIYSRTDHHWAALGAYYAAEEFARVAGLPFRDLSHYDTLCVQRFVGTMPIFSKDASIRKNPETFIYYTPQDIDYTTTYIKYTLDKARRNVVRESSPTQEPYFLKYADGSGMAYCTFFGGDDRLVHVNTGTKNGRSLLILKDSFGNAVPGFLFYSFEHIHIGDCRYFTKNLKAYVAEHNVTDILFANNISHACMTKTINSYKAYLTQ